MDKWPRAVLAIYLFCGAMMGCSGGNPVWEDREPRELAILAGSLMVLWAIVPILLIIFLFGKYIGKQGADEMTEELCCDDYEGFVLPRNIPLGETYYAAPWIVVKERDSGTLRIYDSCSFCCTPFSYGTHEMKMRRVEGKPHCYELDPKEEHIERWGTIADGEVDSLPIAIIVELPAEGMSDRLERIEKKLARISDRLP